MRWLLLSLPFVAGCSFGVATELEDRVAQLERERDTLPGRVDELDGYEAKTPIIERETTQRRDVVETRRYDPGIQLAASGKHPTTRLHVEDQVQVHVEDQLPVGLDGFCPVKLIENSEWVKGDERWGIVHRGRTYLFASADAKGRFWDDPDRYAPILSGNDPVEFAEGGGLVAGSRRHGVFFRNQVYLFTDEDSLQRFWSSPQHFADIAQRAMNRARQRHHVGRAVSGQTAGDKRHGPP